MDLQRRLVAMQEGLGEDMVEYSLLLGFIGLVLFGLLNRFELQIKGLFNMLSSTLPT
jgi:Flp pilus assembly pilin Flp